LLAPLQVFRESLGTSVFTNAKQKPGDYLPEKHQQAGRVVIGTFWERGIPDSGE